MQDKLRDYGKSTSKAPYKQTSSKEVSICDYVVLCHESSRVFPNALFTQKPQLMSQARHTSKELNELNSRFRPCIYLKTFQELYDIDDDNSYKLSPYKKVIPCK